MYDRGKGGRARATGGGKNERSGNLSTFLSPFIYFSVLPKKGISLTAPATAALTPPVGRSRGAMIASFLLFCIIRCEDVTLSILPCQRKSMCAAYVPLPLFARRASKSPTVSPLPPFSSPDATFLSAFFVTLLHHRHLLFFSPLFGA